jgi:PAP2 superfamily
MAGWLHLSVVCGCVDSMNTDIPTAHVTGVSTGHVGLLQVDPITNRLSVNPVSPSPVLRWNGVLADLIAVYRIGPTRSSRAFALLNSAFYDLWATSDAAARPVFGTFNLELAPDQLEPALHHLAAQVLLRWFPSDVSRLDDELAAAMLAAPPVDSLTQQVVEQELLAIPVLDPWATGPAPTPATSSREIDVWWPERVPIDSLGARQSYLTPDWGTLPAFSTDDITRFRPSGPEQFLLVSDDVAQLQLEPGQLMLLHDWTSPSGGVHAAGLYDLRDPANQDWLIGELINPAFLQQAQEVVDLQLNLTDDQKLIAEFWENGAGTAFPPGSWMAITALVAEQRQLSLSEQIKLFFTVGQGLGDAGIAAWDVKAAFNSPRPVRAIRDLASLNLLQGDNLLNWNTYQLPGGPPSPPFPEYVSGHSTFSTAAAEVLATYFGSDAFGLSVSFPAGSSRFEQGSTPEQLTTLAWDSFTEAAESAGLSRLYGGIHFADGNLDGQALGRTVGDAVLNRAATLAYADLTDALQEPFLLSNALELRQGQSALLDGVALPGHLQQIHLANGNDRVDIAPAASFAGQLDGGAGLDQLNYGLYTAPVLVHLGQGTATAIGAIQGFEQVVGGLGDDTLIGSPADNLLQGGGGSDGLDGGAGFDTAVYGGRRNDYRFERDQVIDLRLASSPGHEGTDHLRNIEQLSFSDGSWPTATLFAPIQTSLNLDLTSSSLLVREGQSITLSVERQGDLQDPMLLQLAWQPQSDDRLSSNDLLFNGAQLQFTLPAGQNRIALSLPTAADGVPEGTEVGHLRLDSAQLLGAEHLPVAPQLSWTDTPFELVVLDGDPAPPASAFQQVQSSPLPLRVVPGGLLNVPLTYSVSDQQKDLSGLAFKVEFPASLQVLGFTPSSQATRAASLWSAVEQGARDPDRANQSNAVQISFASEQAIWPGELGQALPLPLGTLRFAASPDFSTADALTGLSVTAVDTNTGYGFAGQAPSLQLARGWSLDVDGDGVVRPLSDGLMILRYLIGMQGTAVTQKAMSPMGSRSKSASVAAWIERGRQENWLDFDGDGRTTALGDGLLLMRSMFGMKGDALLNKAIAPESPLLAGQRYDQLSGDERFWVAQQITERIDALKG